MIEVRLFGDLRHHAGEPGAMSGVVVHVPGGGDGDTVGTVLSRLGIDPARVGHVFVNGCLLPRSCQPIHWGYQLVAQEPLSLEDSLEYPVAKGDRLGLFASKMALVVV
jgi:molybdopterin converting factor small subunit